MFVPTRYLINGPNNNNNNQLINVCIKEWLWKHFYNWSAMKNIVQMNRLKIRLKCRFWFRKFGVGPESLNCKSSKSRTFRSTLQVTTTNGSSQPWLSLGHLWTFDNIVSSLLPRLLQSLWIWVSRHQGIRVFSNLLSYFNIQPELWAVDI